MFTLLLAALLPLIPQPNPPKAGEKLGPEGYKLVIKNGKPKITAETKQGEFWAKVTLKQLKDRGFKEDVEIIDKPKYRMRGFMFDVGRKYFPMETLRKVVVELAKYKFNTLHLHLNDNQIRPWANDPNGEDWSKYYAAFRLECETCPELTAKDGFYTKKEFREFQKWAKTKGVTIIPEFDSPAHALAFTRARPEFGSPKYGMDHFDLDKMDKILPWMEKIFAEYLSGKDPVFIGPYCHIGTDEYDKRDAEKFRVYTDKMFRMVRKYGYKPCAWGALAHAAGSTPVIADKDITMDIWNNGFYNPAKAIEDGYSIVAIPDHELYIVPKAGYYHDYLNLPNLYENWEPCRIGDVRIPADHPQLLGGKLALWNDKLDLPTVDEVTDRIFKAIPTLGQKMWSGKVEGQTWEDFQQLISSAPAVSR